MAQGAERKGCYGWREEGSDRAASFFSSSARRRSYSAIVLLYPAIALSYPAMALSYSAMRFSYGSAVLALMP